MARPPLLYVCLCVRRHAYASVGARQASYSWADSFKHVKWLAKCIPEQLHGCICQCTRTCVCVCVWRSGLHRVYFSSAAAHARQFVTKVRPSQIAPTSGQHIVFSRSICHCNAHKHVLHTAAHTVTHATKHASKITAHSIIGPKCAIAMIRREQLLLPLECLQGRAALATSENQALAPRPLAWNLPDCQDRAPSVLPAVLQLL